jgi:hypothetical protein
MPEHGAQAYRDRAAGLLLRFKATAVERTVAAEVVPALLG